MRDDLMGLAGAFADETDADSLRRIARVLGVPVAAFYGPAIKGSTAGDLVRMEADCLLALVHAHFARVSAEDRRAFSEAVGRLAERA